MLKGRSVRQWVLMNVLQLIFSPKSFQDESIGRSSFTSIPEVGKVGQRADILYSSAITRVTLYSS